MMPIATVTFHLGCEPTNWTGENVLGLQSVVMAALDQRFTSYDAAARAQSDYRSVRAAVEGDGQVTLFGPDETIRAGVAAHPAAADWSAFEDEAAAKITPVCFSIQFTE